MVDGQLVQHEPQGNLIVNNLSAAIKAVEMDMGIAAVNIGHAGPVSKRATFAGCCAPTKPTPSR